MAETQLNLGVCPKCGVNMDMPGIGRSHRCVTRRVTYEAAPFIHTSRPVTRNVTRNVALPDNVTRNVTHDVTPPCLVCEARRAKDRARQMSFRARRKK